VEQSSNSIVITDLDANIEYVNQAFVKETGYSFDEALGQNPRLLNSGKNPKEIYDEMWSCLTRGETWKGEFINRRKDGSEYIESVTTSPVRQSNGQVTHYMAIKENITRRRNNEAKIEWLSRMHQLLSLVNEAIVRTKNRNELFAAICNSSVEAKLFRFAWIGMLDEKRICVIPVVSAGVEEGYMAKVNIRLDDERTSNGPIGRSIRTGIHALVQDIESDPSMSPWRDEALRRGYRASGAFPIYEAGIATGTINVYAEEAHFFSPDIIRLMLDLVSAVSLALDMFANKQRREQVEDEIVQLNVGLEHRVQERTRQLEAANKELEAFSYSVSHDLRAPLRSIDGFSRVLSKKYHAQLDATGQDWLGRVCRASQHMGHLIDDMLQLSQVVRSPLKREWVGLSKIAEDVADDLSKTNSERQVKFVLQQGLSVQADSGLLRIVMNNLLGNAYKFTGKKANAEIEFGERDVGGERTFFVCDNGDGFNMEYAHKLFGTFQRLHTVSEFEGTGIGLATVQRIIRRHNGEVWAEAIEGQGATFYFTLPQRERGGLAEQDAVE
jgi:PAS domain S-box-containing protein